MYIPGGELQVAFSSASFEGYSQIIGACMWLNNFGKIVVKIVHAWLPVPLQCVPMIMVKIVVTIILCTKNMTAGYYGEDVDY